MTKLQGINFRNTPGFVTDGTGDTYDISTGLDYPFTTPQGHSVGWEHGISGTRDRNSGNDSRLAGTAISDATGTQDFRIDLDASGSHDITIAAGDGSYAQHVKVELFDGSTSLGVLVPAGSTSAGNKFKDATGTEYSAAAWPGSNTAVTKTFATTICRFRNGNSANSCSLAHVAVTAAAGGGPTVYNVNVVAISNSVALIGKSVGLKRAASSNAVALNIKSVSLLRLATSNSIALQSHSFIKTISAVAISNSIALISKAVSKSLIAASNGVALISSIKAKLINVVASSNSVALSKRDVGKSLLATSNAVALIQKTVSKPLLAVSNAIALSAKAVSKSLLAISNSVGLNSFIKAKLINVVATSNSVALASRGVGKNLIISSNSAAQISKSIGLNRIASSNSVGLIRKSISLSRLAISASIAYCTKTIPLRLVAVSNAIALAVVALANAIYIEWPERLFKPKKRDRSIKPKKRR